MPCANILGLVIYDLPGRDCAAKASNGELAAGDTASYETKYIDPIVAILKNHSNTAFALIIEPDSLPNLVTNANLTTCQQSASGYRDGVAYALKNLNLPNVVMYIDAGHGGWLGCTFCLFFPPSFSIPTLPSFTSVNPAYMLTHLHTGNDNLAPGAKEIASAYTNAGSPSQVRGFSTNVAGWNSWDQTPGEFASASDAQYNKCQNEKIYVDTFAPLLSQNGMPNHAIVDTGRNAVTGLRLEWGDWCNVKVRCNRPAPLAGLRDYVLVPLLLLLLFFLTGKSKTGCWFWRPADEQHGRRAGRRLRVGQARRRE